MKIIVVGAGASGLMAANILSKNGAEVTLLEAENRIGGRIHTLTPPGFSFQIEGAAEFIHGKLPVTLRLLKKAKLEIAESTGEMYQFKNRKIRSGFGSSKAWAEFGKAAFALAKDCSVQALLDREFSGAKYKTLREEVTDMAQGLDLGDPLKLSVFNVREEWTSSEMQYRPVSGYAPLLDFIRSDSNLGKCQLFLNEHVTRVEWQPGTVKAITGTGFFLADAIVLTVPVSSYHSGSIDFYPEIPEVSRFHDIGFGQVIKIAMEFDSPFWERDHDDLGFLFTPVGFTFWTQLSERKPLLTAWIGNSDAPKYASVSDDELIGTLLTELETAFGQIAKKTFRIAKVFRFAHDSPSKGGYSWYTTKSKAAVAQLNKGILATVYFAGEALEPAGNNATVEAALQSGRYVAHKILRQHLK